MHKEGIRRPIPGITEIADMLREVSLFGASPIVTRIYVIEVNLITPPEVMEVPKRTS